MAVVTCPECRKQVSDKAVMCTDCGFPIENVPFKTSSVIKQQFEAICPECGADVNYQATICSECGYPLKENVVGRATQAPQHEKISNDKNCVRHNKPKKQRLYLIPIGIIIFCVLIIVFALIFHSLNGRKINETDYEQIDSNNTSDTPDTTTAYEASTQPSTSTPATSSQETPRYMVIAGSYSAKENADEAVKQLNEKGFTSFVEWADEFQVFRVIAGLFAVRSDADELVSDLSNAGFESFVRAIEPNSSYEDMSSNAWKKLYTDIIRNDSMFSDTDWKSFALIHINDDVIPELVLEPSARGQTITVYTVINGDLISFTDSARGFSYIERGNLIFYSGTFGGSSYEGVRTIQNGQFEKRFNGECRSIGDYNYNGWYIDDVEVSEEEYQRTFGMFYNESEFTHCEFYTASEIIEIINDPNWGST